MGKKIPTAIIFTGWPLWLWLALTAALLLWPDALIALRYQRESVVGGEYWRLFTANLVHSNGWHWLLNAAGAGLQWWLFQGLGTRRDWSIVALFCLLGNVLGLHLLSPSLDWYVGMSGALYGTAAVGGFWLLARREWLIGWVLTLYMPARVGYEQWGASTEGIAELIGVPVAIDAHLWGLCCGYLCVLLGGLFWRLRLWFSRGPRAA